MSFIQPPIAATPLTAEDLNELEDHTNEMVRKYGGGASFAGVSWTERDQEVVNELVATTKPVDWYGRDLTKPEHLNQLLTWRHPSMHHWAIISMINTTRRTMLTEMSRRQVRARFDRGADGEVKRVMLQAEGYPPVEVRALKGVP